MTTEEQAAMASEFVRVSTEHLKAKSELEAATSKRRTCELAKARLGGNLDALIARNSVDPAGSGAHAKACSDGALAFARAVAEWRAAEVAVAIAQASVDALDKEVLRQLEALVAIYQ